MDSDQYSADLDEEYNIALDRRPRRWLGLFVGLYSRTHTEQGPANILVS